MASGISDGTRGCEHGVNLMQPTVLENKNTIEKQCTESQTELLVTFAKLAVVQARWQASPGKLRMAQSRLRVTIDELEANQNKLNLFQYMLQRIFDELNGIEAILPKACAKFQTNLANFETNLKELKEAKGKSRSLQRKLQVNLDKLQSAQGRLQETPYELQLVQDKSLSLEANLQATFDDLAVAESDLQATFDEWKAVQDEQLQSVPGWLQANLNELKAAGGISQIVYRHFQRNLNEAKETQARWLQSVKVNFQKNLDELKVDQIAQWLLAKANFQKNLEELKVVKGMSPRTHLDSNTNSNLTCPSSIIHSSPNSSVPGFFTGDFLQKLNTPQRDNFLPIFDIRNIWSDNSLD